MKNTYKKTIAIILAMIVLAAAMPIFTASAAPNTMEYPVPSYVENPSEVIFEIDNLHYAKIGDVNFDGKVTIEDATLMQKYLAKMIEFDAYQLCAANILKTREGVSVGAVTALQKHLAQIDNEGFIGELVELPWGYNLFLKEVAETMENTGIVGYADDCIIVTMKHSVSEPNKPWTVEDFPEIATQIESIRDLDYFEDFKGKDYYEYVRWDIFTQQLKITLKEKGKDKVLEAIEKLNGRVSYDVKNAFPNYKLIAYPD
ncbi:MAG: dockerin type I repeat-containing protein [Oscillospiraceae bacterium]|nr:dockerin type I repeat-containing protein [Oscillospiraceae bacterium]